MSLRKITNHSKAVFLEAARGGSIDRDELGVALFGGPVCAVFARDILANALDEETMSALSECVAVMQDADDTIDPVFREFTAALANLSALIARLVDDRVAEAMQEMPEYRNAGPVNVVRTTLREYREKNQI